MTTITNLKNRTHKIVDKFIADIDNITLVNAFERSKLLRHTKLFFDDMNKLSIEEFAKIFTEYNFSSIDIKEHEKYQESLNCLIALIIEKYSQSELLRYFFPENLSEKENRPVFSSHLSKIEHWFQLIGYWIRQLRNKPNYALPEDSPISVSLQHIKNAFKNQTYLSSNTNNDFNKHLDCLVKEIVKKAFLPNMNEISRMNLKNIQEYHQTLINKEQELQAIEKNLLEKSSALIKQEILLSEQQKTLNQQAENLQQKSESLIVMEKFLAQNEESYRERTTLLSEEREAIEKKEKRFESESKGLKEEISKIKARNHKEKSYISHLENENSTLEKRLAETLTKSEPDVSISPIKFTLNKS